MKTNVLIEC